ncbi:hypothetical protein B0H10DRAFT_1944667 [Mycena sp. CBHHK59/15]|nr:hypothetical protein B0H10DRAFT_1944667 [Mycena sp. CBHHK59/15]
MNLQARLTSLINKHKDETWDEGKNNELGLTTDNRSTADHHQDFSDDPKSLTNAYSGRSKSYLCVIRVKRWHETYYYFYPQSSFSGVLAIESLDISAPWKQLGIWTAIGCQRSPQPQF